MRLVFVTIKSIRYKFLRFMLLITPTTKNRKVKLLSLSYSVISKQRFTNDLDPGKKVYVLLLTKKV